MTQLVFCQQCGKDIDTMLSDEHIVTYHKQCWVEFQQSMIHAARGEKWYNLKDSEDKE